LQLLLIIDALRTTLPTRDGDVAAVDGVALSIAPGRALGTVGESVLSLSIMRRVPPPGRIVAGREEPDVAANRHEHETHRECPLR
jgi:peptide/nickel transport system ATP-binding protein/oligopeptide transport system ATP-binding protein